ncbi:MAG: sigma-70 family RNA polymerase sigma factor [Candidatus Uhrbacteria bacterium]|nr:sigma-70 family RNA polymerase sigma factor [Candidatus Uhrbacteria bacterium]
MKLRKSSFNQFYRKHFDGVYRFVFYRVKMNKEVAEDLTSEIFIKALCNFSKFDPNISQVAWIMTIARNHVINHWRDQKEVIDIDQIAFKMEGADGRKELENIDDAMRLYSALNKLCKEDREIIELKYLLGYRYKEIGEIICKSAGAARIDAHRAMKKLRSVFETENSQKITNTVFSTADEQLRSALSPMDIQVALAYAKDGTKEVKL